MAVREAVVRGVLGLLRQEAEVYRFNAGYPEYCQLTVRRLRAFGERK
jgi:hypothetical protein